MKNFYNIDVEKVYEDLNCSKDGLTLEQVLNLQKQYGYNELESTKQDGIIKIFIDQFKDFLIIILIIAAIISGFLGKIESAVVIVGVVILNALLGTFQNLKAEQSLQALKSLSAPNAKVLRNGTKQEINSKEVVAGDIIYLEAGDYVPADARIIENYNLSVNESALTGESESVIKNSMTLLDNNVGIGDQVNMVFAGSYVTYGRAMAVVTAIGQKTEIGKIANLLDSAKQNKTPLQINLDKFGKGLTIIIIFISSIIFVLNVARHNSVIDSFMFAISLAVAAIPEALSSIVTIVLALGTEKLAKRNAIVKKLHAVESLGNISVICSDKTGTLTQNKMTVEKIYVDETIKNIDELKTLNNLEIDLLNYSCLCSDAETRENANIGDPTEIALVDLAEKYNIDELEIRDKYKRILEIPFDSDRKLMSTVNIINDQPIFITKGAVDVLLNKVTAIKTSNGIVPMTDEIKKDICNVNERFSKEALRVLAFGYKPFNQDTINLSDESNLIFVGLIAMIDPPRVESKDAITTCKEAGIRPVMITGDHMITASAIAKKIGILDDNHIVMEGTELKNISDEELSNKINDIAVFARVAPEDKLRIVNILQAKGEIVAMTGDGVNDAPALKQANIGISMGITGTEVAKEAASIVLADDNFATIVKAIENGRSIYENITNSIKFLLSGNTAGIIVILFASLLALPNPFAPLHLLFINLVTDSLPAIAIGLEPYQKNVMKNKPRNINDSIINEENSIQIIIEGLIIAIVTIIAFYIGLNTNNHFTATTMAFATMCLARLFHGLNSRSKHSLFEIGFFTNWYVWGAILIGCGLLGLLLTIEPLMNIFEVTALTNQQLLTIYGLSILPVIIIQTTRVIKSKITR